MLNNKIFLCLAVNIYICHCCVSASVFVQRNLKYNTINVDQYNIDKDPEVCTIQLDSTYNKLCIFTIYRFQMFNFTNFLNGLGQILLKSFNNKYNILICGEGNLNCLFDNNNNKSQFVAVLHSYNLVCIFKFPTKIDPISQTVFGNVFIDTSTIAKYILYIIYYILYIIYYIWTLTS